MSKKILFDLIIVIISLELCSCGESKNIEEIEKNSDMKISDIEQIEDIELSIGDTLEATIFDFTITDIQFTEDVVSTLNDDFLLPPNQRIEYFYGVDGNKYENPNIPEEGYIFLAFNITLKYTGKTDYDNYLDNIIDTLYYIKRNTEY